MNILDQILATKREEVAQRKSELPFDSIHRSAQQVANDPTRRFYSLRNTLLSSDSGIIAEFKRRSPSKGDINRDADAAQVAEQYALCGASAMSVLTDSQYFGGSANDLIAVRRTVDLPILRKDFVVDSYQICEAKLWGADAILLIASALTQEQTDTLAQFAHSLRLEVLLEIHNEQELCYISDYIDIVGVNNRNLGTFVTDTDTSLRLAQQIPSKYVKISESGISQPETVRQLRAVGYKGFLMGENFMKQDDPAQELKQFIASL